MLEQIHLELRTSVASLQSAFTSQIAELRAEMAERHKQIIEELRLLKKRKTEIVMLNPAAAAAVPLVSQPQSMAAPSSPPAAAPTSHSAPIPRFL